MKPIKGLVNSIVNGLDEGLLGRLDWIGSSECSC
jgi:hypothetical protein